MKQPKLTAIIQSRRLTLFGHIMRMDDNADAKRILLASPPADWRRQLGRLRITWLSTVQQDLKQHHLTLPEAADLAQNRPLWRMMSTYGATQSWVACQKRRRRRRCPSSFDIMPPLCFGPLPRAKFHVYRGNVSPLRGENPFLDYWIKQYRHEKHKTIDEFMILFQSLVLTTS